MLQFKKLAFPLVVGSAVLGLMFWLSRTGERVAETPVRVAEVTLAEPGGPWLVPGAAVAGTGTPAGPFVARLHHLRTERLRVDIVGEDGDRTLVRSTALQPSDLLIMGPDQVADRAAVAPVAGADDARLVALTLEAGMNAVACENLPESVRYISPGYRDTWGYNIAVLRQLLKRTYKEFEEPRFELADPPSVHIEGRHALVQAEVRLSATWRGHRNYLLGDKRAPNRLLLRLDKAVYGWKLSRIEGLRPLGFEERFFRLLGGEVGLPLTDAEQQEKKAACAQCRQRMEERFGASPAR